MLRAERVDFDFSTILLSLICIHRVTALLTPLHALPTYTVHPCVCLHYALQDGRATWTFAPSAPISTYIYAVCAGPYEVVSDVYTSAKGTTRQRRRRHFT